MATAINPAGIPGDDIHPDIIEASAARIMTAGGDVRDHGASVVTKWQRLAGVYEAPEAPQLFDVITPVGSTTTAVGDDLETVGTALKAFAAEVRPIVARLNQLKIQAQAFVDTTVANGVSVPASTIYGSSLSGANTYQPSSFGAAPVAAEPTTQPWDENQGAIDRNNQLWNDVAAQQELLWAAERTCANKVRALYGAAALHSATSDNDPLGYGLDQIPDGTKMPWGATAERKEGCGEASVKFVFKGVIWDGIVVGGLWGTVTGLGTLVLGYNPETGGFFDGSAYGASWSGVGMLAVGLATVGPAGAALSFMPGPVGDFVRGGQEALLNAGKGLIAWDKWQDDPGAALGESIFNVATIVVPAGAAVTGVKTASGAARVLTATARVLDVVDPGVWAVKGGLAGIRVVVPTVVDLSKFLRGVDIDGAGNTVPDVRIPDVTGDTLGWHPSHSTADAPTIAAPKFDSPTIDVPPVREPATVGAGPHPGVHTADAPTPIVREPATISADHTAATTTGTAHPAAGNSTPGGGTAPDAPHNSAGTHSGGGDSGTQVLDRPSLHPDGSGSGSGSDGGTSHGGNGHAGGSNHSEGIAADNSSHGGSNSHPDGSAPQGGTAPDVQRPLLPETHPRPEVTQEVRIVGGDVPGSRTSFASRTDLLPDTVYHVEGRGDFYTNAEGRVDYVETTYGGTGNLNPDLQRALPDTTYVVHPTITTPIEGVSHAHVFQTDHLGRVDYAHTDAYALGPADRSEYVQGQVGARGGNGYDGGHTFANSAAGGGEYINLDAMLETVNRDSGDSFYNLEGAWRDTLNADPNTVIPVTVRKIFDGDSLVPEAFIVEYSIDGSAPVIRIFEND